MDLEVEALSDRFDALDDRWLAQVGGLVGELSREVLAATAVLLVAVEITELGRPVQPGRSEARLASGPDAGTGAVHVSAVGAAL